MRKTQEKKRDNSKNYTGRVEIKNWKESARAEKNKQEKKNVEKGMKDKQDREKRMTRRKGKYVRKRQKQTNENK